MYKSYFYGITLFLTSDESGSPHSTHNFKRNYSRSRLDSVGHKVSKHPFNIVQIASTLINESGSRYHLHKWFHYRDIAGEI
ncbi:unnamed protein product [Penicillium roqueforti FM164]|uniref:Genomic scaffold, ProqFM164S02 n=1 Tax=Penicillium roqueforti (strain FM164) TaxID=1365484 RepID=W6Q8L3_PENRF|nr:unnamed protein product [Penicillium roqueforti FM164]